MSRPAAAATLLLIVLSTAGGAPAATSATAKLMVTPGKPYVDDDLKVSFTTPAALRSGHTFSVTVQGSGSCSSSVASKDIKPPKAKGKRIVLTLRPTDQIVDSAPEWCQGAANVKVTEATGDTFLRTIATKSFRFRAKP
jgi:hypothetical protein